jgi:hypothetical protein
MKMRCVVALQTGLALLMAFFVAPFQHVHAANDAHSDHGNSTLIHSHFYALGFRGSNQRGPYATDSDDDDHAYAWSLDSFTLILPGVPLLFLPAGTSLLAFVSPPLFVPVDEVEPRGHDPPQVTHSAPRAPPA